METTPKGAAQQIRSMRNHTPRLSERKKKLFDSKTEPDNDDEDMMIGVKPLTLSKTKYSAAGAANNQKTPKSTKNLEALMGGSGSCKKTPRIISFFEVDSDEAELVGEEKISPSTRRSLRLSGKKVSPNSSKSGSELSSSPHKENIPIKTPSRQQQQEDKQLQKMFNNSMQITPREKAIVIEETSSEDEDADNEDDMVEDKRERIKKNLNKRCVAEASTGLSPMRKIAKKSVSPLESGSISTKSFYSGAKTSPTNNNNNRSTCRNLFGSTNRTSPHNNTTTSSSTNAPRTYKSQSSRRSDPLLINRGVRHRIKKRTSMHVPQRHYAPVDIERILSNVRNEKLRNLITTKREQKQQIEKVHSIFRQASNPIAMAKPLSSLSIQDDSNNNNLPANGKPLLNNNNKTCYGSSHSLAATSSLYNDSDFSDIECDSVDEEEDEDAAFASALRAMDEEVIPIVKHEDAISTKSDDAVSVSSTKRKFFKSGRQTNTKKEVKITGNIRATVKANGKLRLVEEKKKVKKRLKIRNSVASEFSDEQATVDAILRNLDDTAFGDIIETVQDEDEEQVLNANAGDVLNNNEFLDEIDMQLSLMHNQECNSIAGDSQQDVKDDIKPDYNEFIKRLPYNTTDPEIIERQHLLLDFLITNNICTEKNFTIFIADPDNHKEEAERIIDDLVMVVTGQQQDFRQKIPYNTTDPQLIAQQEAFLSFMEENALCTEENFDIFIANYEQRKEEADAILAQYMALDIKLKDEDEMASSSRVTYVTEESAPVGNEHAVTFIPTQNRCNQQQFTEVVVPPVHSPAVSSNENTPKLFPIFYPGGGCQPLSIPATKRKQPQRTWNAGFGQNQYQIDAGQKEFGAHQCKQCGLVYTAHEPEEEKLHRDFHASLHVLRFKGWIDEDIMAIFPEWGPDGRIIRLTETSPLKRKERLMDILKIVDKELGFSSYIIPKTFMAYFAVRKMQIVGLCLVQPLDKANKYMNVNGVDCCTEEEFEAKCGISRIWVSPLHRRFHIATKLIQAVQLNTIYGEEIPLDKIAFSAPTEMGKAFAQKITKMENFLVYQ
ncbi:N-acetyltransferase eco [Musca domestica]|uniref:N-acetyltransferase eco n=1 Tax=Musca domestica TaxID=7370 RepID=A0A9J7I192_MUSDO|nr:N-acetyltransferase eco [Musca domestica]